MSIWLVKDHFKGKVYLKTNCMETAVNYANYYNNHKKVPFTKFKISFATTFCCTEFDVDINPQFGVREAFKLFPSSFKSPFVKNQKHYSRMHTLYLKKKYELVKSLCYKYHLWPYHAKDGHKLCGFDW